MTLTSSALAASMMFVCSCNLLIAEIKKPNHLNLFNIGTTQMEGVRGRNTTVWGKGVFHITFI